MFKLKNQGIGDSWYFVSDDTVHMFFLTKPIDLEGDGWEIGHAVSKDLIDWDYLGYALTRGPEGAWDGECLATGSVIERDDKYWMAFTAFQKGGQVQRIGMAVSDDLTTWRKLPENPVTQPEPPHYEQMSTGQRPQSHWRDPFLLDNGDAVYQFICASRNEGDVKTRGTAALTRSTDMVHWEILAPLEHDRIAEEMEVPQVYQVEGRWYLVFCTQSPLLSPNFAERFENEAPRRSNFSMVGSSALGPFHIHGTGQIVHHANDEYFYAAQLVNLREKWYLMATTHGEVSNVIADPVPVYGDDTGVHAVTDS